MLMSSYSLNEPVPRNIILDFNLETHQPCLTAPFWEKVLFPFGVDQPDLGHCTACFDLFKGNILPSGMSEVVRTHA